MIGVPASNHKRAESGHPLCGEDQVGTMWEEDSLVGCRACQILLRLQSLPRYNHEVCNCSMGAHVDMIRDAEGEYYSAEDVLKIIAEPGVAGAIIYEGKVIVPPEGYRFLLKGQMMNDQQLFWSYMDRWEPDTTPDIFPFNQSYRPRVTRNGTSKP